MDESQKMEQQLWEYVDGICSPEDSVNIKELINSNQEWRVRYHELVVLNTLLKERDLEMPSLRFTKNIMEEIARHQVAPATNTYINKNIIRGLTIFFLLMIGGLMMYLFGQINWTNTYTGNLAPGFKLDINKMHLDKIANTYFSNIFIGVNVIVGLFLADKYLEQKKKNKQEGHWSGGDTA